jgi:hypothetical protein
MFHSPNHISKASPRIPKHQVPEGPLQDFTHIIESTSPEEWQRRTTALQTLVAAIPSGSDYYHLHSSSNDSAEEIWYNSPPVLRHLAIPLGELLKDPRSSVVKRTCEQLDILFQKCQVDARYLLKDIMPAIIQVHASTVNVIRGYILEMTVDAISVVPCKMTMPLWLDRLKHDKSRTVREACCVYLSKAIEEWSVLMEEGYLSKDIYGQVGTALIKALRDAAPSVRQEARKGLEVFYGLQPDIFDRLVATERELVRDVRTKKMLQRIQAGENVGADDVSVASRASRMSVASAPVHRSGGLRSKAGAGTPRRKGLGGGASRIGRTGSRDMLPRSTVPASQSLDIPTTIGVATKPRGGLGAPPQRIITPSTTIDSLEQTSTSGGIMSPLDSPPSKIPSPNPKAANVPFRNAITTPLKPEIVSSEIGVVVAAATTPVLTLEDQNRSFDTTDTDLSEIQPISNTTELKQVAKSRGLNSRRSSLLQDRLLRSSSNIVIHEGTTETTDPSSSSIHGDDPNNMILAADDSLGIETILDIAHMTSDEIANHPNLPEHTKIAHSLLEAHKSHVDQIMETLKVEMDALKEFELILLEQGPRRPNEEEVLVYFEALGVCLDQRTKAGKRLQKEMDRISSGEI